MITFLVIKFFQKLIYTIPARRCGATVDEYLLIKKLDRKEKLSEAEKEILDAYEDREFGMAG